jgi:Glycosyl transferase family 8
MADIGPGQNCAVALCCDRGYFQLALFVLRQIAYHNPGRRFDLVISSQDDLELPQWALDVGMVLHKAGALPEVAEVGRFLGSMAPLVRLTLARELQHRYRRILYLDCDTFVEGGDIGRLMEVDLGQHALGMVLDVDYFFTAKVQSREFQILGWPPVPYANTGVMLIDTKAYVDQDLEARSFAVCAKYPQAVVLGDQSLTNLTLLGKFAQLAPCWNWQLSKILPLVTLRYPIFIRHFIGQGKPDRMTMKGMDPRFNLAYREHIAALAPDLLADVALPCDPAPMTLREVGKLAVQHMISRQVMAAQLKRFPDPYKAVF